MHPQDVAFPGKSTPWKCMSLRACQLRKDRNQSLRCLKNWDSIPVFIGGSCLYGMAQRTSYIALCSFKTQGHACGSPFMFTFLRSFNCVSIAFYPEQNATGILTTSPPTCSDYGPLTEDPAINTCWPCFARYVCSSSFCFCLIKRTICSAALFF